MTAAVDIANRALQKLGEDRISSVFPPDNVKAAKVLNACFNSIRDNELRAHVWSFAKADALLPADATAPLIGYQFQFQMPSDCLRVLVVGGMHAMPGMINYRTGFEQFYKIKGRKIQTDLPAPLALEYIKQVTDTTLFDACFVESFATKLALETCEAITQSGTKKEALRLDYKRSIREAVLSNVIELPPEPITDDSFVFSRL